MDVAELADFDVLKRIPSWAQIRIGSGRFCLYNAQHQIHVTIALEALTPDAIRPMLNNLGGAIFEKEHPNTFIPLIRREAELRLEGKKLAPAEQLIMNRRMELTLNALDA